MRPVLALLVVTAACAPVAAPDRTDDGLARALAGRMPGAPERCVSRTAQSSLQILDRRTLGYRRGDVVWINRQERDCFRPFSTLIVDVHAGGYCAGDRVRPLEQGSSIPGPACILGDWLPYRRPS